MDIRIGKPVSVWLITLIMVFCLLPLCALADNSEGASSPAENVSVEGAASQDAQTQTPDASGQSNDGGVLALSNDGNNASLNPNNTATGALTISNVLMGNDTDSNKEFAFTITLADTSISGTFSGVAFTAGVASVSLKDGESKTIEGLPAGVDYTVAEKDYSADGYETTQVGAAGTLSETAPVVASFTNTRDTYGILCVIKYSTYEGPSYSETDGYIEPNKDFNFKLVLSDTSINGTYGDMTFENGVAYFTLRNNESKKAVGLPNGVTYTVTEIDDLLDGWDLVSVDGDTGTILGDVTEYASFVNHLHYNGLSVTKKVAGNAGETDREFRFTVTLSDTSFNGGCWLVSDPEIWYNPADPDYAQRIIRFKNGVATFTLKAGEIAFADKLPVGVTYTVTEEDYSSDGYVTTKVGDTGTIKSGEAAAAVFTNTRSTGSLKFTKSVEGPVSEESLKDVTFTVKNEGAGEEVGSYTLADLKQSDGSYSMTIDDLPVGDYSVTESNEEVEGYDVEVVYSVEDGKTTVTEGETAEVDITNAYTKNHGGGHEKSATPETGDSNHPELWIAMILLSLAGLFFALTDRRSTRRG